MPRKIRELIGIFGKQILSTVAEKAATATSSTPNGVRVTLSGRLGDDAKPYQEREVKRKIQESQC